MTESPVQVCQVENTGIQDYFQLVLAPTMHFFAKASPEEMAHSLIDQLRKAFAARSPLGQQRYSLIVRINACALEVPLLSAIQKFTKPHKLVLMWQPPLDILIDLFQPGNAFNGVRDLEIRGKFLLSRAFLASLPIALKRLCVREAESDAIKINDSPITCYAALKRLRRLRYLEVACTQFAASAGAPWIDIFTALLGRSNSSVTHFHIDIFAGKQSRSYRVVPFLRRLCNRLSRDTHLKSVRISDPVSDNNHRLFVNMLMRNDSITAFKRRSPHNTISKSGKVSLPALLHLTKRDSPPNTLIAGLLACNRFHALIDASKDRMHSSLTDALDIFDGAPTEGALSDILIKCPAEVSCKVKRLHDTQLEHIENMQATLFLDSDTQAGYSTAILSSESEVSSDSEYQQSGGLLEAPYHAYSDSN